MGFAACVRDNKGKDRSLNTVEVLIGTGVEEEE